MSDNNSSSSITFLLKIMQRLRDPQTGCPWDLQQTYASIAPSTIEEAYEVVDAIERDDFPHLREELGDLLFQVVFYAQLGAEEGRFTFDDIVQTLSEKLLSRHPHVFPDGTLNSHVKPGENIDEEGVKGQWEAIKQKERANKGEQAALAGVPLNLPALSRAEKLQKRAARVGFDWPDSDGVWQKLREETDELKTAIAAGTQRAIEEEFGDLLFAMINLGRHLKIEPEKALRRCNSKFERRFQYIETQLAKQGKSAESASLSVMDALWDEAKLALKESEEI